MPSWTSICSKSTSAKFAIPLRSNLLSALGPVVKSSAPNASLTGKWWPTDVRSNALKTPSSLRQYHPQPSASNVPSTLQCAQLLFLPFKNSRNTTIHANSFHQLKKDLNNSNTKASVLRNINLNSSWERTRKCANQLARVVGRLNFVDRFAENVINFIAFFVDLQNVLKKVVPRDTNSTTNNGAKSDTFATCVG